MYHTDPTYKEWKPYGSRKRLKCFSGHGSYLQGMETILQRHNQQLPLKHGSYLQGMETANTATIFWMVTSHTDPTYKEWKRCVPGRA